MSGLHRILLLIYSIIELRCEKMAILAAPPRLLPEAEQVQSHQRIAPIAIMPVADPEDEGQSESLVNFRGDNVLGADLDMETGDWEPKKTQFIQLWPLSHRSNYRRPGGFVLSPLQGWQAPRRTPAICLTGPSVFRKCCVLLNELGHDWDSIKDRCCSKLKLTTTTSKPEVSATNTISTSLTPHYNLTVNESNNVETSSNTSSSVATEKPIRPKNESVSKVSKSKPIVANLSDDSETIYSVPANETDIQPLQVGEAASATKLQKVKSKEKSPLSLSKEEDDKSDLEEITNASKGVLSPQPKPVIGKAGIPEDTMAREVMHRGDVVTETPVKQSPQLQDISSEEENLSKWTVKNKTPMKINLNFSTKSTSTIDRVTKRSTTVVASDVMEEVSHLSIKSNISSSALTPAKLELTNRNNAVPVSTSSPLLVLPRTQLKLSTITPKVAPPKNKEHNCTFVITGAISGYGYYVYAHSQATTRPEGVKECSQRNMTLAFVTNQNEDNLLRRLMDDNSSYWIGLGKGEGKKRYRWDDGAEPGYYISRYVDLDSDDNKSTRDGLPTFCIVRMTDGKMKVECAAKLTQQLAFPMCMYRPPKI